MHLRIGHSHFPRIVAAAAFAFFVGVGAVVSISALMPTRSAAETSASLNEAAAAANATWWDALVAGTPEAIAPVLAPEFQIMRADGSSYDRDGYLASQLVKVAAIPEFSELVATAEGDHLVVRYYANVEQTRDGVKVQAYAPRLTVYRKEGEKWLVVAHANFAALER